MQARLDEMSKGGLLFRSSLSGNEVWTLYLDSFKDDPIFRDPESSEHNCNHCKNFMRRYGNIVGIEDGKIVTLFDFELPEDDEFAPVVKTLGEFLRGHGVSGIFMETFNELNSLPYEKCTKSSTSFQLGVANNIKQYTQEESEKFGVVEAGEIRTFHHLYLKLNKAFVDFSGKSIEAIMGEARDNKEVFARGMKEIPVDTLELVRDLINQKSLLDGKTHIAKVTAFLEARRAYEKVPTELRDLWCWQKSRNFPYPRFRNELVGTLCVELAEGVDLTKACQNWNKRVDPANYMKATAPITSTQIARAKEFVVEGGYEQSFARRFATLDDIKVSEIRHINRDAGVAAPVSIFDGVAAAAPTRYKRSELKGLQEVSIEKFLEEILPTCSGVEALLLPEMAKNMVTLTTAGSSDSKPIFKWDNNYSWTYAGNLAGKSMIKEAVKVAGGQIVAEVRASLIWNEGGSDHSDLDLWCDEPGSRIGYSTGYRKDSGGKFSPNGGQLDLDERHPRRNLGIENIYYPKTSTMKDGTYLIRVHQFSNDNSAGFKVELEVDGTTYLYNYPRAVRQGSNIQVARLHVKGGVVTVESILPESDGLGTGEIYGLEVGQLHPVSLVCLSPNYWDEQAVGNKHYFFMLRGAKTPEALRSFHIENLRSELLDHKKVLEVLGETTKIQPGGPELSGLGFNATVTDSLIVKLAGTHKRLIKINF